MSWTDVHPDPSCMEGGLVWYGTWGGIHLHFFVDPERKQEFRVCLTGGEANTIAISYDYKGKYWTPITFPNYMCKYRASKFLFNQHTGENCECNWHFVGGGGYINHE